MIDVTTLSNFRPMTLQSFCEASSPTYKSTSCHALKGPQDFRLFRLLVLESPRSFDYTNCGKIIIYNKSFESYICIMKMVNGIKSRKSFWSFFEISSNLRTKLRFAASAKTVVLILKALASVFPEIARYSTTPSWGYFSERLRVKLKISSTNYYSNII